MNNKEIKINNNCLCILKLQPNSLSVKMEYVEFDNPYKKEFDELEVLLGSKRDIPKITFKFINEHPVLQEILFKKYNYCKRLSNSYEGLYEDKKEIKEYYYEDENGYYKEYTRHRMIAYLLNLAYEKYKNDTNVIAYSHRKCGWSNPIYTFNTNFKVEIITNFGYGSKSYFYLKIIYKGIEIVPFRDWIIYEKANLMEIIHYTKTLQTIDKSWEEGMLFLQDASNLALKDESQFVEKFIVQEMREMVLGLEIFLKNEDFTFCTFKKVNIKSKTVGFDLTEFRGLKISGALGFIKKIEQFKEICEIGNCVEKIEQLNIQLKPTLEKEIPLIEKEKIRLEIEEGNLQEKIRILNERERKYMKEKEDIFNQYAEDESISKQAIKVIVSKIFNESRGEEYKKFKKELDYMTNLFKVTRENIYSLKKTIENINTYIDNINNHFHQS